jgi:hypothetical protein
MLQRVRITMWLKGGETISKMNVSAFSGQIRTQQNWRYTHRSARLALARRSTPGYLT